MNSEQALAYWNARRGNGEFRAARKFERDRQTTAGRRLQKEKGVYIKKMRAGKFKWLFNTGRTRPPMRYDWGCP